MARVIVPLLVAAVALLGAGCASTSVPVQVPGNMRGAPFDVPRTLTVPKGYTASVLARVPGARFLAVLPNRDVLVSQPSSGRIHLLRSPGNSNGNPQQFVFAEGLRSPHDMVLRRVGETSWLYVAESHQVNRFVYEPGATRAGARQVVVAGLPDASSPELGGRYAHALKNIAVSDTDLFVSIASTCNACVEDTTSTPVRGAIYRYDLDGRNGRLYARGLRNAEGLDFAPLTKELWVAVNNRDNAALARHGDVDGDGTDDYGEVRPEYVDDHPPDEITRVRDGGDYGWPFCNPDHESPSRWDEMPFLPDAQLNPDGTRVDCATKDRISKGLQAHSAPLGFTFLGATDAPQAYRWGAAVALHGSWNRRRPTGYEVVWYPWDSERRRLGDRFPLVTGWQTGNGYWGRPVDVVADGRGGILVSDDYAGAIYRIAPRPGTEVRAMPAPPP